MNLNVTHVRAEISQHLRALVTPQIALAGKYTIAGQPINVGANRVPSNPELSAIDINADLQNCLHDLCKLKIRIVKKILASDPNFTLSKQAKILLKKTVVSRQDTAEANMHRIDKINDVLSDALKLPMVIKNSEELKNTLQDFSTFLIDRFGENKIQKIPTKAASRQYRKLLQGCGLIEKEIMSAISMRADELLAPSVKFTDHLASVTNKIRELIILYVNNEEDSSWISPTYSASREHQRSLNQHPVPSADDYVRHNFHELMFLANHLSPLMFNGKTLVLSSGLEAFSMILEHESERSKNQTGKILICDDIYFELSYQFDRFIKDKDCTIIPSTSTGEIELEINKELPVTIFTAPMTNSMNRRIVNMENILTTISDPEFVRRWKDKNGPDAKLDLIVDNTTSSLLFDWHKLGIKELPDHIRVIGFESLVKYPGEGKELACGGILTTNSGDIYDIFSEIRLCRGSTLSRHEAAKLDFIGNPERIKERLERHSRNTEILTSVLMRDVDQGLGIFSDVVHAFRDNHPDFDTAIETLSGPGSLISLIPMEYDNIPSKELLDAFQSIAMTVAKKADIDLHCGTSFGLDTSRFAIYAQDYHPDGGEKKYIRFSTGMEDHDNMLAVSYIIAHASKLTEEYFIRTGRID